MISIKSAGAGRPRHESLRALTSAALLCSTSMAASAAAVISGTPATTVTAAHYYSFQPGASASPGKTLTFSISNKPSWAQFDARTGYVYGTPLPQSNIGTYSNISISASDGTSRAYLAPFSIRVLPLPNTPPVVGGTPASTVVSGHAYSFQPTARDPNGLRLTFAIASKPPWAAFNSATGALMGTPTAGNVGTWSGIVITAYDGYAKAALPAFAIVVQPAVGSASPPPASSQTGSATLSWAPPNETTSGTTLTNLAGYHIYYGSTPSLGSEVTIPNPGLTRYVISGLTAATWYFQMTAYDSMGVEGPPTARESIVMP
jgi:Putative Ig domain